MFSLRILVRLSGCLIDRNHRPVRRIVTTYVYTERDLSCSPMRSSWKYALPSGLSKAPTYGLPWANSPFRCKLTTHTCTHTTALIAKCRIILKIFTAEFYSIGALFAIYGAGILLISLLRRQQGNKQFFSEIGEDGLNRKKFRTSGNVVIVLTALSMAAYGCLLGLTLKLGDA